MQENAGGLFFDNFLKRHLFMFELGVSKTDITAFKQDVGMMGYGMHFNIVKGKETALNARAFIFRNPDTGKKIGIVVCEMAFITISIKRGVLKKLHRFHADWNYTDENLLLTAQHTHSGPGGYSHYGFYNLTIPGFVADVYQQIVEGIFDAIVQAEGNLQPATLRLAEERMPDDWEVAFNRSIKAYLTNPDAEKVDPKDTHLAVDRVMKLLRMDSADGKPLAAMNWFGVHTTSLHNDNRHINWDNKGYAADEMEKRLAAEVQNPGFLSAFAQGPAGDITPNYVWDKKKKWTRGKYESDIESAKYNGHLQQELAVKIWEKALSSPALDSDLDAGLMYVNFANVEPHPDFTNGKTGVRTGPACHGVSFFAGTVEGPGMPGVVAWASRRLSELMQGYELALSVFWGKEKRKAIRLKYKIHGRKHILVEAGERKILATRDVKNLIVPGFADQSIKNFKAHHRSGGLDVKPWTPQVLPLQIVIMGTLAIVAIPGEPTTIAGKRMRELMLKELAPRGITEVIISPYSNAYTGYITTFEEYQLQCYEGGHTVFGEYTLAAFLTKLRELAREMVKKSEERNILSLEQPVEFTQEELGKRSYAR